MDHSGSYIAQPSAIPCAPKRRETRRSAMRYALAMWLCAATFAHADTIHVRPGPNAINRPSTVQTMEMR